MIHLIATGPQDYSHLVGAGTWRGLAIPEGGLEPAPVLAMLGALSLRLNRAQGWGTWFGVAEGEVVCSVAVKDVPRAGSVEIGYGTAPARRGRGHAAASVRALLPLLLAKGVVQVRAETALDNPASRRVLQKAGFARAGTRDDPGDGALDLWVWPAPQGAGSPASAVDAGFQAG
ncbi:MAG: GNAT family N-acetyltransferase [Paracoccaceae bacterium]